MAASAANIVLIRNPKACLKTDANKRPKPAEQADA